LKYNFNKDLFRISLAFVLIVLGVLLFNYADYQEYDLTCSSYRCTYNKTFFEDLYLIEVSTPMGTDLNPHYNFSSEGVLYIGESMTYSNYEERPFLVKNFLSFLIINILITFLINHIWFRKGVQK